jgi:predicted metal-dependent phosphoesterase TrpH
MARLDLHVHTEYSPDSRLGIEAVMENLGPVGLQGFALTDHNTRAGHARIAALREQYPRYWILPGMEASTREGHVLLYGLREDPPRRPTLVELLDWADDHDVVAVLAHPFRWVHGVGRLAQTVLADGLETRNGRTAEIANIKAEVTAARRHAATTGGSDAHELSSLGRAYTEFPDPIESIDDLIAALRRRSCHAEGRSLSLGGRLALAARNGVLRAGRGFRAI